MELWVSTLIVLSFVLAGNFLQGRGLVFSGILEIALQAGKMFLRYHANWLAVPEDTLKKKTNLI